MLAFLSITEGLFIFIDSLLRWYKMAKLLDFPDQELQELRIIIKMGPEKEKIQKVETPAS